MSSLKNLKLRIKSVRSTQKITKAMQMVSASKFRRSRVLMESNIHYAQSLRITALDIVKEAKLQGIHNIWTSNNIPKTQLLIVITSNRGLCGSFNSHVMREAEKWIDKQTSEIKIWCIGNKILNHCMAHRKAVDYSNIELMKKNVKFVDAVDLGNKVMTAFKNKEFESCTIIYGEFISTLVQKPKVIKILPFDIEQNEALLKNIKSENSSDINDISSIYDFEPRAGEMLDIIMERLVIGEIFEALLHSQVSENAARMTAMDNATRNASDMIKDLTLIMNRTRQASITRELIEIISGAEAL